MSDETGTPKVIPLLKQDTKVTIKQTLWEVYYAIYAMTLATDVEGVEMEDSEIEEIEDDLQRDLIFSMREIRGYSEKAWFALFELVKKHQLDERCVPSLLHCSIPRPASRLSPADASPAHSHHD
jgi:hypothetical protein